MSSGTQLDLLGDERRPWLDRLRQRLHTWTERGVWFGTSSWKYEGWLGQIYSRDRYQVRGRFSKPAFERECLEEYAETFPSVCGDFSFYQFYGESFWQRLFAQVPSSFQFGFKVPETITCPFFPDHPRYGAERGKPNAHFLDADLLQRDFLDRLRPYRGQIGYLVFEFPQFHRPTADSNARFLEQLDQFLGRLPAGFPYSVEIRTAPLLGADYFACLRRHGVGHAFNSWTRMPTIGEQVAAPGAFTSDPVVARVLLRPGRAYEEAVQLFQPYAEVRDPYPEGYRDVARLVRAATEPAAKRKVFVVINTRWVGNAIRAIEAILDELEK